MDERLKKSQLARLSRTEGQVRGVARMVEEDRYCIDVINQVRAVRAALDKVEQEILHDPGKVWVRADLVDIDH